MGADDANEGGDGCIEHVWQMAGIDFDDVGTHVEHACTRCGALRIEGSDELRGQRPER